MGLRLALVIHGLSHGGAERVLSQLATHWAAQGHDVTLITLSRAETDTYPLHRNVKRVGLDLLRESRSWWERVFNHRRRVKELRKVFKNVRPDVIVGFTEKSNILALQAAKGLNARVVIAERTDPRHHRIGRQWEFLRRRLYSQADLLVVQTEGVGEYAAREYGCPVRVIPNGAPVVSAALKAPEKKEKRLIGVGRLDVHKQFDVLVGIFARLEREFPEWRLQIVGTGPEEERLRRLIQESGLESKVELAGWVGEVLPVLQQGEIFVSTSRYEGFPNALLEGMACGLPAVSFDCESGPREIIRNEIDGILVPNGDDESLEQALRELMGDDQKRKEMGFAAREVQTRFGREAFFEKWDGALQASD